MPALSSSASADNPTCGWPSRGLGHLRLDKWHPLGLSVLSFPTDPLLTHFVQPEEGGEIQKLPKLLLQSRAWKSPQCFLPLLCAGCHLPMGYLRSGMGGRKLSPRSLTELNGLEPILNRLLQSWHGRRKECMQKGRLRMPGPLAWASGRVAEGSQPCCCLQAGLGDHPEACPKAHSCGSIIANNISCKTQAKLSVLGLNWGLPFIFWEVSSELWVSMFPETPTRYRSFRQGLAHCTYSINVFEQWINTSFIPWKSKILNEIIKLWAQTHQL